MTSNYVDASGLHLQTLTEIVTELENGFKSIYGPSINVDPNSPDGQMINLFAQAKIDILDLISQVYNSFSPTTAIGTVLDQRCAINGIIRKGATFTTVNILVTTNAIVNLIGASSGNGTPFTVSDPSGNLFYLISDTTTINGSNTLLFTSAVAGAIEVTPNTITTISTPILGVLSVNNPSGAVNAGIDEETDAALRYRRSVSVSNPSSGYLDGLIGALLGVENVINAIVYENNTEVTDGDGIPPHSIWPIVDYVGPTGVTGMTGATGVSGAQSEIANIIYNRRNAGCGMYGNITVNLLQTNGFTIPIKYSYVTYEYLYITLNITSINPTHTVDQVYIKNQIADNIKYGINEVADYSAISAYIKSLDNLAVVVSGGLGTTGPTGATAPFISPTTIDKRWIIQSNNITIYTV